MTVRITEHDAFADDVLWPLDEVRIDDEYEAKVDDLLARLSVVDDLQTALMNSAWERMQRS
jgi:hypothetical protein